MKFSEILFPPPVRARHVKRTFVSSPDDEASHPTREVIELTLKVVARTLELDLSDVSARMGATPHWADTWPGEHYRLLAGFVAHLQPKTVVEIGTHRGVSALSLRKYLPPDGRLVTFDLIEWGNIPETCLSQRDFGDGQLTQVIGDLADPAVFREHAGLLANAQLIFVDGPKDRRFEPAFASHLDGVSFQAPPWVIFDDIRDLNMLQFWRDIRYPKLDISSFGHWTGTGLVCWDKQAQVTRPIGN